MGHDRKVDRANQIVTVARSMRSKKQSFKIEMTCTNSFQSTSRNVYNEYRVKPGYNCQYLVVC